VTTGQYVLDFTGARHRDLAHSLPRHAGGVELIKQCCHVGRVVQPLLANAASTPPCTSSDLHCHSSTRLVRWVCERLRCIGCAVRVGDRADGTSSIIPLLLLVMFAAVEQSSCTRRRRLARDERNVVVHTEMTGAVVVRQECTLLGKRLPKVTVLVQPGKSRVIGLIFLDDEPDVLDPPTGVPVEEMTHSALELPSVGTSSLLPVGQLLGCRVREPIDALDTAMP